jgi:hypothetical protein
MNKQKLIRQGIAAALVSVVGFSGSGFASPQQQKEENPFLTSLQQKPKSTASGVGAGTSMMAPVPVEAPPASPTRPPARPALVEAPPARPVPVEAPPPGNPFLDSLSAGPASFSPVRRPLPPRASLGTTTGGSKPDAGAADVVVAKLKGQLDAVNAEKEALQKKFDTKAAALKERTALARDQDTEIGRLREEVALLKKQDRAAKKTQADLQAQVGRLQAEVGQLRAQADVDAEDIRARDERVQQDDERIQELEARVVALSQAPEEKKPAVELVVGHQSSDSDDDFDFEAAKQRLAARPADDADEEDAGGDASDEGEEDEKELPPQPGGGGEESAHEVHDAVDDEGHEADVEDLLGVAGDASAR